MITYVNNTNAIKYSVLFANATEALAQAGVQENGEKIVISTIEQYFKYLKDLSQIDVTADGDYSDLHAAGRRYTMLPLDENYFEIDANKRTISVPTTFASNGIGVQGDQLAEVLYFKVDRFFDARDLDNTNIYIQWVNADGVKGISTPFVVDIKSEANKLIFGWAIPNVITSAPGSIQFAVRFYERSTGTKLAYSLATQTATVSVKSTLDFSLNIADLENLVSTDKDNELLIRRIQTSETQLAGLDQAETPIYFLDLVDSDSSGLIKSEIVEDDETIVLYLADLDDNGIYLLKVQAQAPDTGTVTVKWYEDGVTYEGADGTDVFEVTEDTTPQAGKMYYIEDTEVLSETEKVYKAVAPETFEAGVTYYDKFSTFEATEVGRYYAIATNRLVGENNATKKSNIVEVVSPSVPIKVNDLENSKVLTEESGTVELTVEYDNTEANGTKSGVLAYKWFFDSGSEDDEIAEVEISDDDVKSISEDGKTLTLTYTDQTEKKEIEGLYRVEVTNSKNGVTVSEAVNEEERLTSCYVSFAAEAPILEDKESVSDGRVLVTFNPAIGYADIDVEIDTDWLAQWNISGAIQYQWFKTTEDLVAEPTGPVDDTDDDVVIEGATEATYRATEIGNYYCVVTNVKNGTEASSISQIFAVA